MDRRSRRRTLSISYHPLKLIACIALGLWLGFVAILLTSVVAWQRWGEVPVALQAPPPLPAAPQAVEPEPRAPMFEQYQRNLQRQERTPGDAKCQFWLQQERTAPSDHSRANVLQFCGWNDE